MRECSDELGCALPGVVARNLAVTRMRNLAQYIVHGMETTWITATSKSGLTLDRIPGALAAFCGSLMSPKAAFTTVIGKVHFPHCCRVLPSDCRVLLVRNNGTALKRYPDDRAPLVYAVFPGRRLLIVKQHERLRGGHSRCFDTYPAMTAGLRG